MLSRPLSTPTQRRSSSSYTLATPLVRFLRAMDREEPCPSFLPLDLFNAVMHTHHPFSLHLTEILREYFNPEYLDDSMGGEIPVDAAWNTEAYGKRMSALDFDVDTALMGAELELSRLRNKAAATE